LHFFTLRFLFYQPVVVNFYFIKNKNPGPLMRNSGGDDCRRLVVY